MSKTTKTATHHLFGNRFESRFESRFERHRKTMLGGALLAVALLGAACGSASGSGSTTTTPKVTNAAPASSGAALVKTADSAKFGKILVSSTGYTLYYYTRDAKNVSHCTNAPASGGSCIALWPPLVPPGMHAGIAHAMSGFGIIHRPGGGLQVTYHEMPLYTYTGDTAAGQTSGQDVQGIWFVVKVGMAPFGGTSHSGGSKTTTTTSSGGGYGY